MPYALLEQFKCKRYLSPYPKESKSRKWRDLGSADGYFRRLPKTNGVRTPHKKGNSWIWEQIGNRPNHYLDCEAMNCAGALMLKIFGNDSSKS